MELNTKNPKSPTPLKDPLGIQSKVRGISKFAENLNPNVSRSSPSPKPTNSPLTKSSKSQKSASKKPVVSQNPVVYSPRNKIRERKFVVAKKISKKGKVNSNSAMDCKCKERFGANVKKCLCVAYETLRASQEEFFKNRDGIEEKGELDIEKAYGYRAERDIEEDELDKGFRTQNLEIADGDGSGSQNLGEMEQSGQMLCSTIKRRRDKLLDEARSSVPESGKVIHLIKTFENLLSVPSLKETDKREEEEMDENKKKAMQRALPGLQPRKAPETKVPSSSFTLPGFKPPKEPETQVSSSPFFPPELFLTSENLGLDSRLSVSSSRDSSQGSVSSRTSNGQRSRRNSSESCGTMGGRRWKKKQLKVTCQKPFSLRTEQRGKSKEEEFTKKMHDMMIEEERQRIPIARGLPWTTDEPECLIKPPVRDNTRPIDLKLHSDIRAVDRAYFDYQVAENINLIEQYKIERDRQQKLAEEEEIRRLRKELIPKAQPMPYFDRPFLPTRSTKYPTVPKEPNFQIPHLKKIKCCLSWDELSTFTYE